MQVTIHIPRSFIRNNIYRSTTSLDVNLVDPFNEAATAAIGVPVYVGFYKVYLDGTLEVVANTPRSAKAALKKYINGTLDSPVRFRITIPDMKG